MVTVTEVGGSVTANNWGAVVASPRSLNLNFPLRTVAVVLMVVIPALLVMVGVDERSRYRPFQFRCASRCLREQG